LSETSDGVRWGRMTAYRTIAFDQNTMAYHGGDPGWVRHANTGNLSRPSLEPDLSDLPLVRPIGRQRFGRRIRLAQRAPNVLGDLTLVRPVGPQRFGRRIRLTQHAPNVLGDWFDPSILTDIDDAVKAAATVATTAYGLDQAHKQAQDQKAAASAAQQQAASTAAAAAAAAAAAPGPAPTPDAPAPGAPEGVPGKDGKGGTGSKILMYAAGGAVLLAVLVLLTRRPAPAAASATPTKKA
jgi:hypothetical protein